MKQCGVCNKENINLGIFSGMYCCKECASRLIKLNVTILEGKYIIYQKEVKIYE